METIGAYILHDLFWEPRGKPHDFDCSQDAGELFTAGQTCAMCARSSSAPWLAAQTLAPGKHQLMARAEFGRSSQVGLGGRRGHWRRCWIRALKGAAWEGGRAEWSTEQRLKLYRFLGFCSSDIQSEMSVHSLGILEAIEEKKYYMECCFAWRISIDVTVTKLF